MTLIITLLMSYYMHIHVIIKLMNIFSKASDGKPEHCATEIFANLND